MAAFKEYQIELNERLIAVLAEMSGYEYDFLYDRFQETMDDDGDIAYFVGVTLEKDW